MKNQYIILIVSCFLYLGFTSCEDAFGDFLDKAPNAQIEEDEVFSDWLYTEYYHNDIYNFLRSGLGRVNNSWLDSASDIAETSYTWGGIDNSLNFGNYYGGGAAPEVIDSWDHYYKAIRKCNIFLARAPEVPLMADETEEDREEKLIAKSAEARFLRAFFHWELIYRYGAIPIITTRIDQDDEYDWTRPKTVDECFKFVLDELNIVQEILPATVLDKDLGRPTKTACIALKSRILLYYASPMYNPDNELERWERAMLTSDSLLTGRQFGTVHSLTPDYSTNFQVRPFLDKLPGTDNINKEPIFWRNSAAGDWWRNETPVSFGGFGGLCPSQNLVDMYDMADGSSPFAEYDETGAPVYDSNGYPEINPVSGYDEQNPYENRDPRFYKTVLYNGATWWNLPIETFTAGKDKPIGNGDATETGYYNRKYLDDTQTHYLNGGSMYRNWIFIRYAEMYLNYAEAANELNASPDAQPKIYTYLETLRRRAGITTPVPRGMSKEQMRSFIRRERTVELAFEEHRWWDVRRWKVADKALNRPVYGMEITKNNDGSFTYKRVLVENRIFLEQMYLYPIPEKEIYKTGMENNPGWDTKN